MRLLLFELETLHPVIVAVMVALLVGPASAGSTNSSSRIVLKKYRERRSTSHITCGYGIPTKPPRVKPTKSAGTSAATVGNSARGSF